MLVKGIDNQGTFAGPGNAGYAGQGAQRNFAVNAAQIVGRYIAQEQGALALAPFIRQRDGFVAAQVAGSQRVGLAQQLIHIALKHDFAALGAGTRAKLDDGARFADRGFIMLDNQHRIAAFLQGAQSAEQTLVVARMQADGRLVQNVCNAHKAGAQLRGQANALGLAAGKRVHGAPERKIIQADIFHKGQAAGDFLEQRFGNQGLFACKFAGGQPLAGAVNWQVAKLGNIQVANAHG